MRRRFRLAWFRVGCFLRGHREIAALADADLLPVSDRLLQAIERAVHDRRMDGKTAAWLLRRLDGW